MRHLTRFTTIILLLWASSLSAQQHQHRGDTTERGMMGQGQGMMGEREASMPGMALQAFAPKHLLATREDLGLTDDQVIQLEELLANAQRVHDQAMASHDTYRDQMMEALHAELPDPTKVRGLMAGAHESMGQAHWAEMEAALTAMTILTDVQRAQVRKAQPGAGMQRHHGEGRQ